MSLKSIREVTEITGITVNALRYYDSKGVLHPTVRNPEGRKEWLYDDEAIRRAKRILLLRSIGIPVENIGCLLNGEEVIDKTIVRSRLQELLAEREAIDKQISVAGMLLLLDEMSPGAEEKNDMLDRMFEMVCR